MTIIPTPPPASSGPSRSVRVGSGPLTGLLRWGLLGAAAFAFGVQSLVAQAPANDAFSSPLSLASSTNVVAGSNLSATAEPGEPAHAGNPATASVWWTWVAPDTGPVVVDTHGSALDTVLAVYTGNAVNALTLVAANDDAPGVATSLVGFIAQRGTAYRIAVDGYLGASGAIQLSLRLAVAPTAPAITNQPASVTVPDNAGSNVTFAVSVTGSAPLTFTWQRNGVDLLGGTGASYTVTSAVQANAGNYRVIITNAFGSVTSSVAVLTVLATSGQDAFAGRATLTGATNTSTTHNIGATSEAGEPVHASVPSGASVWWTWTAPRSGLATLDTAGSTNSGGGVLDTVLAVYAGNTVNALTPVAANDDEVQAVLKSSQALFRAAAGVTYQIAVAGKHDANGSAAVGGITLNLALAPDNDYFTNALVFPAGGTTVRDDNTGATAEAGEPTHAGLPGSRSVWWRWVAPSNGTYVLDTVGSAIDTVLAVYTGSAINSLTRIAEDDNRSADGASLVKFLALGGTEYYFVVDGFTGANGAAAGRMALNLSASQALNDHFADRTTLSGQTNQISASNLGATKEPGEPNHGGNAGGRSLWWTWTAPLSAPVLITTRNSAFDTTLAVYTGSQLASLALVAENDEADLANPSAGSSVLFTATAGQTYQIAVDGYRFVDGTVAEGAVALGLYQGTPPALGGNDQFANRFPIVGQTNTVIGSNTNATKEAGEPAHAGNDGGRSVWWTWTAPASTPVRFDTVGSSFDTVLAVYAGSAMNVLTLVDADSHSGVGGRSVVTFEAVQGVEYQIAVDGFNNGDGPENGRVVLNLRQFPPGALHANDEFASAPPIAAPFLTVAGNNIGATRQAGEPAHGTASSGHSVWWTWTAPTDGPVTISTTNSQFDTILAVYTGAGVGTLTLVAENDDLDAFNLQSGVRFQAAAGTVYRIAVDGYGGEVGLLTLTVAPEADTPAPPQIQAAPLDQTRFAGGGGGGTNVTFRVVATGSLPLSYQWRRGGSVLADATNSVLTLTNVTAGDAGSYQVAISNHVGSITSSVAELAIFAAPFNDDFASRILLTGTSNQVRGSIQAATKQTGETRHGGETGGGSVWWRWVAPANGLVEMHTHGSAFDTVLAVYQGADLNSLTLVAENNDVLNDRASASRVLFNAVAGQEYQIAVDGEKTNHFSGSVVLTVRQAPPPPLITVPPPSVASVHVTNGNFRLAVTTAGLTPLFRYQWTFNGNALPNATNASLALGPLSRANSGNYAVIITNDFGSVTSSTASVWIQVPQVLLPPQRLPDGRVQLRFSDPDGTLSSDSSRFEVHHTFNPSGPTTVWVTNLGGITINSGRFLFEDQTSGGVPRRTYRVMEK